MMIIFETSYWCLFSVSAEFLYTKVSALEKYKCGEVRTANHDHGISDGLNVLIHVEYATFLQWQLFEIVYFF